MTRFFHFCFFTLCCFSHTLAQTTAAFSFTEVCEGNETEFTDQSFASGADSIVSWDWAFGDGNSSSDENPEHTYAAAGVYEVILVVESSANVTDTATETIEVFHMPQASINAAPLIGCEPLEVEFTNNTTIDSNSIEGYLWDFGDGNTSEMEAPTHLYYTLGNHEIILVATSNKGCQDTATESIFVLQNPEADFTAGLQGVNNGSPTVQFTNQSTGNGQWFWEFGDGNTSTSYNTTHTYDSTGTYNVRLTITASNSCTDVADYFITITENGLQQVPNGIDEPSVFQSVSVFPNPCRDFVHIAFELRQRQKVNMQITDLRGAVVQEIPQVWFSSGVHEKNIPLEDKLRSGSYFLVLNTDRQRKTLKLIVQE